MSEGPIPERELATAFAVRLVALGALGLVLVYLRAILVPMVLAVLLAFLVQPLVAWLTRRSVPGVLAILLAQAVATLPFLGVVVIAAATSAPLQVELSEKYRPRLEDQGRKFIERAIQLLPEGDLRDQVKAEVGDKSVKDGVAQVVSVAQDSFVAAYTFLGYFFMTLILSAFILAEGTRFREKFGEAFGADHALLGSLEGIGQDVRAYVVAKSLISALTGFFVWAFLEMLNVDFALLWGIVAFPLNFIPTVGAFIASVPPILFAVVDPEMSAAGAWVVVLGLMAINGVIGTVLDPRFVGQTVKLSPLVVLLSMLVWYVLWGPVGMLLAVPIMVSVKVVCARVPALEPLATMMQG